MSDAATEVMKQLALWDYVNGLWEVLIPVTPTVTVQVGEEEWFDVMVELDQAFEDAGLTFNNFSIDGNTLSINGIDLC